MVLLQKPGDFKDFNDVLDFAQKNQTILGLFTNDASSEEDKNEIGKYQDFYNEIEYVGRLLVGNNEGAQNSVFELNDKLCEIIQDATKKKDNLDNPVLYTLYKDFIAQQYELQKMLSWMHFQLQKQVSTIRQMEISAANMVLLKKPGDFKDLSQVLDFAQQNHSILGLFTSNASSEEDKNEIGKYQDLYNDIEFAVRLLVSDNEGAQNSVFKLSDKLCEMLQDATRKKDNLDNPVLYSLYNDFIAQQYELRKMLCLMYFQLQKQVSTLGQIEINAANMILLKKPGDFKDLSQVLNFAQQNHSILGLFTSNASSEEGKNEIEKYQHFYNEIEYVVSLLVGDNEGAQNSVFDLNDKVCKIIQDAMNKKDNCNNPVLYSLYNDFVAQQYELRKMLCLMNCELQKRVFAIKQEENNAVTANKNKVQTSNLNEVGGIAAQKSVLDFQSKPEMDSEAVDREELRVNEILGAVSGHSVEQFLNSPGMNECLKEKENNAAKANKNKVQTSNLNEVRGVAPQRSVLDFQSKPEMDSEAADREELRVNEILGAESGHSVEQFLNSPGMNECLKRKSGEEKANANKPRTSLPITNDTESVEMTQSREEMFPVHSEAADWEILRADEILDAVNDQESVCHNGNGAAKVGKLPGAEKNKFLQPFREIWTCLKPRLPEDISSINPRGFENDIKKPEPLGVFPPNPTATGLEEYALVKSSAASAYQESREDRVLTTDSDLKTLEDSLKAFDLFPRLLQLERSIENVRRHRIEPLEHEKLCKQLDKDIQKLSQVYHPDMVMRQKGSKEEVEHAQKLQTALNATRTVLRTLNKIFLEDIDIDHKYEFFTKLDLGLLGNEDEVENHVYEVLFKISLISEIKQESIVAEIKRFLEASQRCVESYIHSSEMKSDGSVSDFPKQRALAFFHLKRCVNGYKKLQAELKEVKEECRSEKLSNIYSLIHKMSRDCSQQLKHLDTLDEMCQHSLKKTFRIYESSEPLDDYFVLPLVCYTNVIMACSLMFKYNSVKNTSRFAQFCSHITGDRISNANYQIRGDDKISNLYRLASRFNKSKKAEESFRDQQFLMTLLDVDEYLKKKFNIDDYIESGTKKHIMKELKACREMKAEFEKKKEELVSNIKQINENNDSIKEMLDKLEKNSRYVSNQIQDCLTDAKKFKQEIGDYSLRKM